MFKRIISKYQYLAENYTFINNEKSLQEINLIIESEHIKKKFYFSKTFIY